MSDANLARDYIAKVVERSSLTREKFSDSRVPSSLNSLCVIPFFGDVRHESIFSTLVLNKWKELNKFSYLVVCSWPGHHGLYPYADEYWSLGDPATLNNLVRGANGFVNTNIGFLEKILLRYLDNPQLLLPDDNQITRFYNHGITVQYLRESGEVLHTLPTIPAVNSALSRSIADSNRQSVFLMPTLYINSWRRRGSTPIVTTKDFWVALVEELNKKYRVIVYQNYFTHDIGDQVSEVTVLNDWNIMTALSAMRGSDCVLDVFNQTSRYAFIARAPVLVLDERQRFFGARDYEIDDLCSHGIPKRYLFSFAPIVEGDHKFIIEAILHKVQDFLATVDRTQLPSTAERSMNVSYSAVRKRELKQIGMRFFKPPKLDEED